MARSSTTRIGRGVGMGWGVAGAGWGGPAKGAGSSRRKKPIDSTERAMELNAKRGTPEALARRNQKAHTTAILHGMLFDIAMDDGAPPQAQVAAAVALLNRLDGLPVARSVAPNRDARERPTDEELAEIAAVNAGANTSAALDADERTMLNIPQRRRGGTSRCASPSRREPRLKRSVDQAQNGRPHIGG